MKNETLNAEVIEEGAIILSPVKDLDLTEGVDLDELMKTYAEVPEIDPEAENAGEQYQYVLKGHKAFVSARNKIEKVRKALKAPALEFGKLVDGKAKALKEKIADKEMALYLQRKKVEDNEERKMREAEEAERKRQENINTIINTIKNLPLLAVGRSAEEIKEIMTGAEKPTEDVCEERYKEALAEWEKADEALNTMLVQAEAFEVAKRIKEEEDKRKAEEDAKREAEMRAEREAFEREKAEFEAEKARMKAEKEAKEEAERLEALEREAEELIKSPEIYPTHEEAERLEALEPTSTAEYVWQWLYTYGGSKWMITDSHLTEEEAKSRVVTAYIHTLRKVHESKMDRNAYRYYKTKRAENDRFR